jgi:hypothetical protein
MGIAMGNRMELSMELNMGYSIRPEYFGLPRVTSSTPSSPCFLMQLNGRPAPGRRLPAT